MKFLLKRRLSSTASRDRKTEWRRRHAVRRSRRARAAVVSVGKCLDVTTGKSLRLVARVRVGKREKREAGEIEQFSLS